MKHLQENFRRDDNGDPIDDRTLHTFKSFDSDYFGLAPSIEIRVRMNMDREEPEFVIYELTRAWMAVCKHINEAAANPTTPKDPTP